MQRNLISEQNLFWIDHEVLANPGRARKCSTIFHSNFWNCWQLQSISAEIKYSLSMLQAHSAALRLIRNPLRLIRFITSIGCIKIHLTISKLKQTQWNSSFIQTLSKFVRHSKTRGRLIATGVRLIKTLSESLRTRHDQVSTHLCSLQCFNQFRLLFFF